VADIVPRKIETVLMASLGPGRLGAELDRETELFAMSQMSG
jgi:hypothetical protein